IGEDHRDRGGGSFYGESGWRRHHYDDIDAKPDHLGCEFRESLDVALGIAPFDNKGPALFVPELPQAAEQLCVKRLLPVRDKTHSPDLAAPWRPCTDRPGSDPTACKDNKIAPLHGFPANPDACHTAPARRENERRNVPRMPGGM